MCGLRKTLVVAGVLVLCGSAANAVAGDVYDESGVLRPEFVDNTIAVEKFQDPALVISQMPDAWGIADLTSYNISSGDVIPRFDSEFTWSGIDYYIYHHAGNYFFVASFHVPTGALVLGVIPYYYDNDADENFWFWIYDTTAPAGGPPSALGIMNFQSGGTPGYAAPVIPFAPPFTAFNFDLTLGEAHFYNITIRLGSGTAEAAVRFGGMNVIYQLQISPEPVSATFVDVPVGDFGFKHVEALVASGITAGCAPDYFCPNDPVTRVQMAVFLAKALGLHWPDF